ncbi:ABC transporter ATP-binding protein [Kocuria tytonicola]|uniref:ABC transporter ATP-binding protein n=1 Tax=Kocuria tytonicola TaxID=2055946 RepID=UPI000EF86FB6|nr:ATP-binding cassette domain-containing protein [Kocuria tytonicola]RLZ03950.1 ABC transporter ATP-binding protein [Kocuria tytonicola]
MTAAGPVPAGAAVELRRFGWHYPGRQDASLSEVTTTVAPGERVLLLGPSGAGKSTLLQALAGVEQDPDGQSGSGEVLVDGADPRDARGAVGFMHQDPETQVVLSRVGDDVAFGLENLAVPREQIWPRVRDALERVGLDLPLEHPTTALSGGQKQRLALAGVLAMRPRLLLLDEPTASVDGQGAQELCGAVARAVRDEGITLVVVEHRVALWESVVDRVVVLDEHGRVAFDGPTHETLHEARALLQEQGTWVPGWVPETRPPAHRSDSRAPATGTGTGPASRAPSVEAPATVPVTATATATATAAATPAASDGAVLLSARDLAVSRVQPTRRAVARRRRRARAAWRRGQEAPEPAAVPDVPVAAENISLDVRAGRALAVTGVNGAGKSTLALTLAGLLVPVRGTVRASARLAGDAPRDPSLWDGGELVARVGTVFQHPEHQFLRPTVRQELEFGPEQLRRRAGVAHRTDPPATEDDAARVAELLHRLRLADLADANPFTLSGGQKRRLSVATVLAAAPDVLILDEPTFGQDARTWQELVDLLVTELDRGTAVVAVTHDRDLIDALAAEELELGA